MPSDPRKIDPSAAPARTPLGVMIGVAGGHGVHPAGASGRPSIIHSVYVEDLDAHCKNARAEGTVFSQRWGTSLSVIVSTSASIRSCIAGAFTSCCVEANGEEIAG